jgi:hypothetical protein
LQRKDRKAKGAKTAHYERRLSTDERRSRRRASTHYSKQGAVERFNDPYNGNRAYYYNHDTATTTWEPPEGWKDDPTAPTCTCCGPGVKICANKGGKKAPKMHTGKSGWVHHCDV